MLKERFLKLAAKYSSDNELCLCLWDEIQIQYTSSSRYYHNLSHLESIINELDNLQIYFEDEDSLLFATFYHDLIYDVNEADNEEKSAQLAVKRLSELSVPPAVIENCFQHIIATKSHSGRHLKDTAYFLDADLCILGYSPESYEEYAKNIRKEYGIFSDEMYSSGRQKVLIHFLQMNSIYKTSAFRDRYEEQARENMELELSSLREINRDI